MRKALVSGRGLFALVIAGGVVAGASVAAGDDLMPPEWRGEPNSVFAEWERSGPTVNDPLERVGFDVPGGGFPIFDGDPDGTGPITDGSQAQLVGFTPFTPSGGIWEFYMPNVVDPLPQKLIQIQLTYDPPLDGGPANTEIEFYDIFDSEDPDPMAIGPDIVQGPETIPGTNLTYEKWFGEIIPNPDYEFIRITTSGDLTQVVIDTWSVPAPGAMGVVALAGLAASRRRR